MSIQGSISGIRDDFSMVGTLKTENDKKSLGLDGRKTIKLGSGVDVNKAVSESLNKSFTAGMDEKGNTKGKSLLDRSFSEIEFDPPKDEFKDGGEINDDELDGPAEFDRPEQGGVDDKPLAHLLHELDTSVDQGSEVQQPSDGPQPGAVGNGFDDEFVDVGEEGAIAQREHFEAIMGEITDADRRNYDAGKDNDQAKADTCAYLRHYAKPHESGVLATVGRFFQSIGLFLRSIFVSDEFDMESMNDALAEKDFSQVAPPNTSDRTLVKHSTYMLALAHGLDDHEGKPVVKGYRKNAHVPSFSDIKQNPALQDCWFLASVAALLNSKGPAYIGRMIEFEDDTNYARVHFADKSYRVPCGMIVDRGNEKAPTVSDSAPWVRLLETAMQMRLIDELKQNIANGSINGVKDFSMENRNVELALNALFGSSRPLQDGEKTLANLAGMLDRHEPVVLGHDKGLFDFVAPGHAVTLLDVNTANNTLTIMDPYGRVLTKDASFLDNCTVLTTAPGAAE